MQELQPQFTTGANNLTRIFRNIARGIADKPPQLDFGKINADMSLTTNLFPQPIPCDEYSVCRSVLYSDAYPLTEDMAGFSEPTKITVPDGAHIHICNSPYCPWGAPSGQHWHWVSLPKKMRRLKPGDKVLVAWIQNEAVVIDIVYSAKYLRDDTEPVWT